MRATTPLEERYWKKVQKTPTCWFWTGALRNGYGTINRGARGLGVAYAHHLAWELRHGQPVPAGKWVLHRCDVRKCVNPDHLWVGDQQENIQDAVLKGRHPHGETSGRSKLTTLQVMAIHDLRAKGWKLRQLGELFGVTRTAIGAITQGRNWRAPLEP